MAATAGVTRRAVIALSLAGTSLVAAAGGGAGGSATLGPGGRRTRAGALGATRVEAIALALVIARASLGARCVTIARARGALLQAGLGMVTARSARTVAIARALLAVPI